MANHPSALKRARQAEKRRMRNRSVKSAIRTQLNKLNAAIEAGNKEEATVLFQKAQKLLAKAASGGTIHDRNASRRIGRLAVRVHAL